MRLNQKINRLQLTLNVIAITVLTLIVTTARADETRFGNPDYHAPTTAFDSFNVSGNALVEKTLDNLRVFNLQMARALDRTEFSMSALEVPGPDDWDHRYLDDVEQTKTFVTPVGVDGLMFELQLKY